MTAKHDLDRRLRDYYAAEAPGRAPDWVLDSALDAIDATPQRHVHLELPRRLKHMHASAKLAAAAAVIVAAGLLGLAFLGPGQGPQVGGPQTSPSASPSPTSRPSSSAPPSTSLRPTPGTYVPGELTRTFSSTIHGISISYPEDWAAQPATEPWTTGTLMNFGDPAGDFLHHPTKLDHLFIELGSWNLAATSFDAWSASMFASEGCDSAESLTIDGAAGLIDRECGMALVESRGRGYLMWMYVSGDDADLQEFDSTGFFSEVLETVQLRPEDAVDGGPSASP